MTKAKSVSHMIRKIETPYAVTTYYNFPGGGLYFESLQKTEKLTCMFDAFPNFWSLAYALDLPEGKVFLVRRGQLIPVSGNVGLFIPPFSILDWRLNIGLVEWKAVIQFSEPPVLAPKHATMFQLRYELPLTRSGINEEIFGLIKTGQRVDKEEKVIPLGLKAKQAIDLSFSDSVLMDNLCKDLGCSPSAMSRAFKASYGISPVAYRNQLRVYDASLKMLMGESVTKAAHDVGFQDLSRFNKQFKIKMRAIPSQFKLGPAAR